MRSPKYPTQYACLSTYRTMQLFSSRDDVIVCVCRIFKEFEKKREKKSKPKDLKIMMKKCLKLKKDLELDDSQKKEFRKAVTTNKNQKKIDKKLFMTYFEKVIKHTVDPEQLHGIAKNKVKPIDT